MSFLRHSEIYQVSEANCGDRELKGRDPAATPFAHRLDESPVGYSLAGCSPAEPASASPTEVTLKQWRGELQEGIGRNVDPTLTRGLTLGAHPNISRQPTANQFIVSAQIPNREVGDISRRAPGRAHSLGGESPLRARQGESLAGRQGCPP